MDPDLLKTRLRSAHNAESRAMTRLRRAQTLYEKRYLTRVRLQQKLFEMDDQVARVIARLENAK